MPQKKDQRLIRSENAIIEAGIETLLVNSSAGMTEIAEAAGIGRATLYRHFESREALIQALVMKCYEEIETALEPHRHLKGRAALETIIDLLMPIANRFKFLVNLWAIVEDDKAVKRIEEQMYEELYRVFDQAKKEGEVDAGLPIAWLTAFFDSALTAGWVLVEEEEMSSEDAARYIKHCFFNGCGKGR